uniref:Uncharacterized protein n=1 Tax=Palpitomonas bilix TaxID=652834 RepID=A0A7S3D930_9EUKA|mmetsp:Transcript_26686/g.68547  ORF Transcript_26686/g.68547 Transcript_26686/m.68547 type:complete len:355 (+) Transcript_26686:85-1149(+)
MSKGGGQGSGSPAQAREGAGYYLQLAAFEVPLFVIGYIVSTRLLKVSRYFKRPQSSSLRLRALGITLMTFASLTGFLRFALDACELKYAEDTPLLPNKLVKDEVATSICDGPLLTMAVNEDTHRWVQRLHKGLSGAASVVYPSLLAISIAVEVDFSLFSRLYRSLPLAELGTLLCFAVASLFLPTSVHTAVGAVSFLSILLICSKRALRRKESYKWQAYAATVAFSVFGAFAMDTLSSNSGSGPSSSPASTSLLPDLSSANSVGEAFASILVWMKDMPTTFLYPIDLLHACLALAVISVGVGSEVHAYNMRKAEVEAEKARKDKGETKAKATTAEKGGSGGEKEEKSDANKKND